MCLFHTMLSLFKEAKHLQTGEVTNTETESHYTTS